MSTWQFHTNLNPDRTLSLPPDVAAQLEANVPIHVVLITGETEDEADWQRLVTEQFFQGYAPDDDIYDQLPAG